MKANSVKLKTEKNISLNSEVGVVVMASGYKPGE